MKRTIIFLFLICNLFCLPVYHSFAEEIPENVITEESITNPEIDENKVTLEEFIALPDDAKREIYFNSPEQLPDNFNPESFMNILYVDPESNE